MTAMSQTDPKVFLLRHEQAMMQLFERIDEARDGLIERIRTICEIPAPTFQEGKRTRYLLEQLPLLGLRETHALPGGCVLGYTRSREERNTLVMAAHIDTVFSMETDVSTRIDGNHLLGAGIGDNATGVAATLELMRLLGECAIRPARNIAIAGTVGEEGKGSLKGIREVLDELGERVSAVIAVDGTLDTVVNRSLAIRRYEVTADGPGGHAWTDFGKQSAIHAMANIVSAIAALEVPSKPRTTFNVGTIRGGRSVNAIAEQCVIEIELRSIEQQVLDSIEQDFLTILRRATGEGIRIAEKVIDDRPGASLPPNSPLAQIAVESAAHLGIETTLRASSTDATIPLSRGIEAVCIGAYQGQGAHSEQEQLELDSLVVGLKRLALALLMTTGIEEG